jgi:hypothetical protein
MMLDFYLAILPVPIIWNTKLSRRKRLGISVLLGCGVITGAVSAVRAIFTGLTISRGDFSVQMYILNITTSVETTLIIVLGSLPPLRVLYNKFFGSSKPLRSTIYLPTFVSRDRTVNDGTKPGYIPMDSWENHSSEQPQLPENIHDRPKEPSRNLAQEVHVTQTFEARWESASVAARRNSCKNMF